MTNYRIKYVPDEMLSGRDFVLCNEHEDGITLAMRRGIRDLPEEENVAVWEAAWVAFRALADVDEIPPQRAYRSSASAAP